MWPVGLQCTKGYSMPDKFELEVETAKFRNWTRRLAKNVRSDLGRQVLRKVGLEAARRFIQKTPVDTGRARAGWTAIFDLAGAPVVVWGTSSAAQSEGKSKGSVVESFTGAEQFIEIINAVAYVIYLEYGHSQQAPAGMVRVTLREISSEQLMAKTLAEEFANQVNRTNRGS